MNLGLSRNHIRRLVVDELAVVLYFRLLLNLPLFVIVGIALIRLVNILWNDALEGHWWSTMKTIVLTLYLSWTLWTLLIIRQELSQRDHQELTHTPTFYSWAKATHVLAAISLLRPLFASWLSLSAVVFDTAAIYAWALSSVMAGFYLVYFLLLLLVWRKPPLSIALAFVLALAAAIFRPTLSSHQ